MITAVFSKALATGAADTQDASADVVLTGHTPIKSDNSSEFPPYEFFPAAEGSLRRDIYGNIWFEELSEEWEGQSFSIRVKDILQNIVSEFGQHILVFTSDRWGTVLALNGAIQVTSLDESSYQEMMVHTAMQLVPEGKALNVLVIGGGDGGVLRELGKYSEIKKNSFR